MPKNYIKFTVKFRSFWMWSNLIGVLSSILMGTMTYWVLDNYPNDCAGIRQVTWCLLVFHFVNFVFCALAVCGLEKRLCNNLALLGFILFDTILLIWSQITYFYAQGQMCNISATVTYFWLMTEIIFFYVLTAFIVCYFFRRFCQDPNLQKEEDEEDLQEAKSARSQSIQLTAGVKPAGDKTDDLEVPAGKPITDQ